MPTVPSLQAAPAAMAGVPVGARLDAVAGQPVTGGDEAAAAVQAAAEHGGTVEFRWALPLSELAGVNQEALVPLHVVDAAEVERQWAWEIYRQEAEAEEAALLAELGFDPAEDACMLGAGHSWMEQSAAMVGAPILLPTRAPVPSI